jgi:hypothetical protein
MVDKLQILLRLAINPAALFQILNESSWEKMEEILACNFYTNKIIS